MNCLAIPFHLRAWLGVLYGEFEIPWLSLLPFQAGGKTFCINKYTGRSERGREKAREGGKKGGGRLREQQEKGGTEEGRGEVIPLQCSNQSDL